jgi:NADPH:quinone reductase
MGTSSQVSILYFSVYICDGLLNACSFLRLLSSGKVSPVVWNKIYPFEQLTDGLVALEQRKTWGKAVVHVRDSDETVTTKAKL